MSNVSDITGLIDKLSDDDQKELFNRLKDNLYMCKLDGHKICIYSKDQNELRLKLVQEIIENIDKYHDAFYSSNRYNDYRHTCEICGEDDYNLEGHLKTHDADGIIITLGLYTNTDLLFD